MTWNVAHKLDELRVFDCITYNPHRFSPDDPTQLRGKCNDCGARQLAEPEGLGDLDGVLRVEGHAKACLPDRYGMRIMWDIIVPHIPFDPIEEASDIWTLSKMFGLLSPQLGENLNG
jgi:hypothetical protein